MGKSMKCPGFRFKPTDVELAMYYLKKKLLGKELYPEVIAEINIYHFSPWDLPDKSILSGDLEWYFFCSISKKYSSGPRMKRATETGYWKATGKDREVKYNGRTVAMIKTLVFHMDHPPKGTRTNWVMHEMRMNDEDLANKGVAQEAYVICKVFEKRGVGPQIGAQYGAPFNEEEWDDDDDDDDGRSTVTSSGATINTLDPNASTSGPSTITSWDNEKHIDVRVNDDVMITNGDDDLIVCNKDTQEVEDRKGKKVMAVPVNKIDVSVNDDVMLTHGKVALMLCNNDTQEVEDPKGKKVMTGLCDDADYVTLEELLDDTGEDAFHLSDIDGSDDYNLDAFQLDDDFWNF